MAICFDSVFRQLLQKQEKEINIIFFLQHCSVFKYSEKQA